MDERKWENLDMDCLANLFGRVDMKSLLQNVPLVCKSWYKTSHNPLCWQNLVFPSYHDPFWDSLKGISADDFVKLVIDRSHQSCTIIKISRRCSAEGLHYIANKCPALRSLSLSHDFEDFPELIRNWKQLESLAVVCFYDLVKILTEISLHCKNFRSLDLSVSLYHHIGFTSPYISDDQASAIVSFLPNLKCLILKGTMLIEKSLLMILQSCKDLEHFDVRYCIGLEIDGKILHLASHIPTFKYEILRIVNGIIDIDSSHIQIIFGED